MEAAEVEEDETMKMSRSLFDYIFKLFYPVYYVLTIPLRIFHWFFANFPIFSSLSLFMFVSFVLIVLYIFRRLSSTPRENFINYLLYTVLPYGTSIVYTAITLVFPQVNTVTRILGALLHPIKFILGLVEKVDRRAEPIRRTVEALHGSKKSTKSERKSIEETLNDGRLQCCVCQFEEKCVLLRPCNHLCLCERCNEAINRQPNKICPICRAEIESFELVYIS
ncbi:unnamed protein product [Caenorhabditis angaria]|uniref:RING-type domain-containing protein n=1 Tax=Caenorhabditis angaria TaxID=860376 RepID=A0A9P1IXK6_9PELO|nr:unnamed protein product [Caenorhabditis angaria]